MRKVLLFAALLVSAMSFAAVSITVTPNNVDFGTVTLLGHETTGVEGLVTIDVTYSGLQQYCGVVFEDVEMPEENCGFWLDGTNTAGWIYSGDQYNAAEGKGLKLHYYATDPGVYTGKIAFYSYEDADWTIESPKVYLTMKLTVIAGELPKKEMVRVNSTSELKDGDVVIFVSESAKAVCGPLNGAYLPAVTDGVTIANGTVTFPEATTQTFTASKYSGNWQFTTTDTGKRLHLDITGKGAFTYADTQADAILANWGVSISNGVATVSKPDGTFPVEFNSDRFKPYKSAGSGTSIALYKEVKANPGTDVENVQTSEVSVQKIFRNGQLIIIRNGEEYSVTGARAQ